MSQTFRNLVNFVLLCVWFASTVLFCSTEIFGCLVQPDLKESKGTDTPLRHSRETNSVPPVGNPQESTKAPIPNKTPVQGQVDDFEQKQAYLRELFRHGGGSMKDVFFDEMLQVAIEAPDLFDGWEIAEGETRQMQQQLLADYHDFRQKCFEKMATLTYEDQIRAEVDLLVKQRRDLSQSLTHPFIFEPHHLRPEQRVALLPMASERYGLVGHATNDRLLGKWLNITAEQRERHQIESAKICAEVENLVIKYRQRAADIFFKNLTKPQVEKFFGVFSREKVRHAYGTFSPSVLYYRHKYTGVSTKNIADPLSFPAFSVLIGDQQDRAENLSAQEADKPSTPHPTTPQISNPPSQQGNFDAREEYVDIPLPPEIAWRRFFAFEFALIKIDLMEEENQSESNLELVTQIREMIDRENAHFSAKFAADQLEIFSDPWFERQPALISASKALLGDLEAFFSTDERKELLSLLTYPESDFYFISKSKGFRTWLEISDQQLEQMRKDSQTMLTEIEQDVNRLRQNSADAFFNCLDHEQRIKFFEIFDREKQALYWGSLSPRQIFEHHNNAKGEPWSIARPHTGSFLLNYYHPIGNRLSLVTDIEFPE